MMHEPDNCETCGRDLTNWRPDIYSTPASPQQPADMRAIAAQNLHRHNLALDQMNQKLDALLELVQSGTAAESEAGAPQVWPQVLEELTTLRKTLQPRHGLCIDRGCALCRVHEEAIKEHVLVYIDWRVPGTIQKLQQARHRN
jgi:hypothetical protein